MLSRPPAPPADRRRQRRREQQRRHRERERAGVTMVMVTVDGSIINMLVRTHWLNPEREVHTSAEIADAIAAMLQDAGKR
jgi:hypothetical protein